MNVPAHSPAIQHRVAAMIEIFMSRGKRVANEARVHAVRGTSHVDKRASEQMERSDSVKVCHAVFVAAHNEQHTAGLTDFYQKGVLHEN